MAPRGPVQETRARPRVTERRAFDFDHRARLKVLKDWKRYEASGKKGLRLPNIEILNDSDADWREITAQFQFYPVVRTPRAFLPVDLSELSIGRSTQDLSFVAEAGYGNLAIAPQAPIFTSLAQRVADARGLAMSDVAVRMFLPQDFLDYLAWKVMSACRSIGLAPEKVELARTSFSHRGGRWIYVINSLVDTRGQSRKVK